MLLESFRSVGTTTLTNFSACCGKMALSVHLDMRCGRDLFAEKLPVANPTVSYGIDARVQKTRLQSHF